MTSFLLLITYVTFPLPQDSLVLPFSCATVKVNDDEIFCAPFTGNTVCRIRPDRTITTFTFTDDSRTRIVDLAITPFALFINNGREIIRYFRTTLEPATIVSAQDISSFALTRFEDIIYADQYSRTVHFLDYTGKEKNRLEDLLARDLTVIDTTICILTNTSVVVYDEFGNLLTANPHSGVFNRMHIQGDRTYLFSPGQQVLQMMTDDDTVSYGLPFVIQDIAGKDSLIYVLNDRGSVLYLYHHAAF
jgi:hypothetical protein